MTFGRSRFAVRRSRGARDNQKDVFYHLLGEGDYSNVDKIHDKALAADSLLVVIAVCFPVSKI
jgi:hypothetical protein